ncbi:hypothetical protein B4919_06905 [Francisella tularensis subsp. novicida]|uniref:hypothetical protein n=1 Tax=Francisella tularensis TaxID=263 RepID=UPI000CE2B626|nr:hypothetical protein [Francisella tularensis]AVC44529.1 hypothetical protein B4919_06905 [Francisella tularensis subsp. novicida]
MEKNNIIEVLSILESFCFSQKQKELIDYIKSLNLSDDNEYSYFLVSAIVRESVEQIFLVKNYVSEDKNTQIETFVSSEIACTYKKITKQNDTNDEDIKKQNNFKKWFFLQLLEIDSLEIFEKIKQSHKEICRLAHIDFRNAKDPIPLFENLKKVLEDFKDVILKDILNIEHYIQDDLYFIDKDQVLENLNDTGSGHYEAGGICDEDIINDSIKLNSDSITFDISFTLEADNWFGGKGDDGMYFPNNQYCQQTIVLKPFKEIISGYLEELNDINNLDFGGYIKDYVIDEYRTKDFKLIKSKFLDETCS